MLAKLLARSVKWFRDGWKEIRETFGGKPETDPEGKARVLGQTALALATAIGTYGSDEDKARARVAVVQAALQDPELRAGLRDPSMAQDPNPILDLAEYTLRV